MSSVAEIDIIQTLQVQLPLGLLGFERIKTYSLIAKPDQEPFRWLSWWCLPALSCRTMPPI
jgi:hypothetical protein